MRLFDSPRDIRKRQEPGIGFAEALLCEADIQHIPNEEEKRLKEKVFRQAMADYKAARLGLERAKRKYSAQIDVIRTRIGLPKFLDS